MTDERRKEIECRAILTYGAPNAARHGISIASACWPVKANHGR